MTLILFGCLVALIFISAFFSGAETGMMATNRYKLRAKVKAGNRGATRTQNLLQRPDRLLGMILIGNTFANIAASALATVLASRLWGDAGVVITTIVLTLVILLFSEVLPKTFAAFKPESYAFAASGPLSTLLTLFFPLIWLVNTLAAWLLKPFGIKVQHKGADPLSIEELRHAVHASSSTLAQKHQAMLLGVMDLEKSTVEEVMIPRSKIVGLDTSDPIDDIEKIILKTPYSVLPVYQKDFEKTVGMLYVRDALPLIAQQSFNKTTFKRCLRTAYFVPETTSLQQQLIAFQKRAEHTALVVDEYGDVQGVLSVEDIIEEIVGALDTTSKHTQSPIKHNKDGSYNVPASLAIRDINRQLGLDLPTDTAKTLAGLITDVLQDLPTPNTTVDIGAVSITIISVKDNVVTQTKLKF